MAALTGLYIHWPFCLAKCPYCDFNVHVRNDIDQSLWRDAYLGALRHYASLLPDIQIASVFFGGGTPSLMAPDTAAAVLRTADELWGLAADCEITLEANPTSVESEKFRAFRQAGINRVSLGIQALNDRDLSFLGRRHNLKEALKAIESARQNFDRWSFDLIYARPGQTLADWETELAHACTLADGHLSLYQLTIERNTPFYFDAAQGKFSVLAEDLAADFYDITQDILEQAALPAYEVSNHARGGEESRHNLIYWRYHDYIGIGPGAHGRLTINGQKFASREHAAPDIWLRKVGEDGHAAHPFDPITPDGQFTEALMMGLRLREGVALSALEEVGGSSWQEKLDETRMRRLADEGWLAVNDNQLSLSREGRLRLNAIVPYLLKD